MVNPWKPVEKDFHTHTHQKKRKPKLRYRTHTHSPKHTHPSAPTHTRRLQQEQKIVGPKGKWWLIVPSESPGSSGKTKPKKPKQPPKSPLSKETTSRKFSSALETWSFQLFLQSSSLHLRKMQPKVTCANTRSQEYLLLFLKGCP